MLWHTKRLAPAARAPSIRLRVPSLRTRFVAS